MKRPYQLAVTAPARFRRPSAPLRTRVSRRLPPYSLITLKTRFSVLNGPLSWVLTFDSGLGSGIFRYRSRVFTMIAVMLKCDPPNYLIHQDENLIYF